MPFHADPPRGTLSRRRRWRRLAPLAVAAIAAATLAYAGAAAPPAHAAVFQKSPNIKWPTANGLTLIRVCVTDDSTSTQAPPLSGILTDPNPSLDTVVGRVRDALRTSWESGTSVRFFDW